MAYKRRTPQAAQARLDDLGVELDDYRRQSELLATRLGSAVAACIAAGATWGEVGDVLGMSKQAARQHWIHATQPEDAEPGTE